MYGTVPAQHTDDLVDCHIVNQYISIISHFPISRIAEASQLLKKVMKISLMMLNLVAASLLMIYDIVDDDAIDQLENGSEDGNNDNIDVDDDDSVTIPKGKGHTLMTEIVCIWIKRKQPINPLLIFKKKSK